MTRTIDWNLTEAQMCLLPQKDLRKLIKFARRELSERNAERWALKERLPGAFQGMANVMAGVTWALACRASLRASKGHRPAAGTRPASGEMWLPAELLKACRLDVKEKGWSPLTAPYFTHFQAQFGKNYRAPDSDEPVDVQFAVRMARGTAVRVTDSVTSR